MIQSCMCVCVCAAVRVGGGQATGVPFKYFGMQAGHACFCGDSFGSQGKVADAQCGQPCLGNSSEMCGGAWLNSVWATQPLE